MQKIAYINIILGLESGAQGSDCSTCKSSEVSENRKELTFSFI